MDLSEHNMQANFIAETPLGYLQSPVAGLVTMAAIWSAVFPDIKMETSRYQVMIQAEDANIRWRDDGGDPTASMGMLLNIGDTFLYTGINPNALKFFSTGAKLNITAWR